MDVFFWAINPRVAFWTRFEVNFRLGGNQGPLFLNGLTSRRVPGQLQQSRIAEVRRRHTRIVGVIAMGAFILAGWGWKERERGNDTIIQLNETVIKTKALSLWSRLELDSDVLSPATLDALWDLTQAPKAVRINFI